MVNTSEMKFYQIAFQGDKAIFQYEVGETGAEVSIKFTMDQADQDTVQTMLDRFEARIGYMLSGNSWEPTASGDGLFKPDSKG